LATTTNVQGQIAYSPFFSFLPLPFLLHLRFSRTTRYSTPSTTSPLLTKIIRFTHRSSPQPSNSLHTPLFAQNLDMRRDVQEIFKSTPHHKQVMMFSATLAKEIRTTCKKFMQSVRPLLLLITSSTYTHSSNLIQPLEIYVDDEKKLTLHGLQQHFVRLEEAAKNRKLNDLLDSLEFNQASSTGLGIPVYTS